MPRAPIRPPLPDHDDEGPSKTQLKKQAHELQELGEAVAALPDSRLEGLALDERLRDAILEFRRTRSFEGRRRQLQYIGKLMKFSDVEPLREAVAAFRLGSATDSLALHQAERWRDELLADDDTLERWLAEHPATDVQQMRSLVRSARREKLEPGARHGRAFRELFQFVKAHLLEVPDREPETGSDPTDDD